MQVAIARMKDVADRKIVTLSEFADEAEGRSDLGSRNDAVLDVVGRAESPDCAESVLAALPQ